MIACIRDPRTPRIGPKFSKMGHFGSVGEKRTSISRPDILDIFVMRYYSKLQLQTDHCNFKLFEVPCCDSYDGSHDMTSRDVTWCHMMYHMMYNDVRNNRSVISNEFIKVVYHSNYIIPNRKSYSSSYWYTTPPNTLSCLLDWCYRWWTLVEEE